jgi:hypothetical protein
MGKRLYRENLAMRTESDRIVEKKCEKDKTVLLSDSVAG